MVGRIFLRSQSTVNGTSAIQRGTQQVRHLLQFYLFNFSRAEPLGQALASQAPDAAQAVQHSISVQEDRAASSAGRAILVGKRTACAVSARRATNSARRIGTHPSRQNYNIIILSHFYHVLITCSSLYYRYLVPRYPGTCIIMRLPWVLPVVL